MGIRQEKCGGRRGGRRSFVAFWRLFGRCYGRLGRVIFFFEEFRRLVVVG